MENATQFTANSRSLGRSNPRLLPLSLALALLAVTGRASPAYGEVMAVNVPEDARSVEFDRGAVAVAPTLVLTGKDDDKLKEATVLLTDNFVPDQDRLALAGTPPDQGISWTYDQENGKLTLSGEATVKAYQDVLRKVTYQNSHETPSPDARTVLITIGSSLYYEGTGHYYEFVRKPGIRWAAAKEEAAGKNYHGLKGYLATVTSKGEDQFIASKLQGQGWMGASDADRDKVWKWVTGPEADTIFFYQKGYLAENPCGNGPSDQQPEPKQYSNWTFNEPNDNPGGCEKKEDYAHFRTDGTWNDYALTNTAVQGYVVEYGGMPDESKLQPTGKVTLTSSGSKPPSPTSFGEVHMRTPDGLAYDFQSVGEFVLVKSVDDQVRVQTRQEKWPGNPNVSVNTAVAMSVDGNTVGIYHELGSQQSYLDVNGTNTVLKPGEAKKLDLGGYVQRLADDKYQRPRYLVKWPDGFLVGATVFAGQRVDVGVSKPEGTQATYEGLAGNLDGEPKNDLQVRNGTALKPPASFQQIHSELGQSWCVSSGDSLFKRGERVACDPPKEAVTVHNLTAEQRTTAEQHCGGITDEIVRSNCMLDVGLTDDESFAETAETVQTTWPAAVVAGDQVHEGETGEAPLGIPFTISNASFPLLSLSGIFEGWIYVHPRRIDVAVDKATIYRRDDIESQVFLRSLSVTLRTASPGAGIEEAAGSSESHAIDKMMKPGDKLPVKDIFFSIPKTEQMDLSKHWIVFEIWEATGYSPAGSERDIFSYHPAPPEPETGSGPDTCERAARERGLFDRLGGGAAALCQYAETSVEPIHCFEQVMGHGAFRWGAFEDQVHAEREGWVLAIDLCRGSIDADRTVECFHQIAHGEEYGEIAEQIARGLPWRELIRDIHDICNRR